MLVHSYVSFVLCLSLLQCGVNTQLDFYKVVGEVMVLSQF